MATEKLKYVTDDRDKPEDEQLALFLFQGGNGDWYVQVGQKDQNPCTGVRLCTSGGASTHCPGLTGAIADAYQAMQAAANGTTIQTRLNLEAELFAWRSQFPEHRFFHGRIVSAQ